MFHIPEIRAARRVGGRRRAERLERVRVRRRRREIPSGSALRVVRSGIARAAKLPAPCIASYSSCEAPVLWNPKSVKRGGVWHATQFPRLRSRKMRSPSSSSEPNWNGWSMSWNAPSAGVMNLGSVEHGDELPQAHRVVGVALELARLARQDVLLEEAVVRRGVLELERFDVRRDEPRHRVQDLLVTGAVDVDAELLRQPEILRDRGIRAREHPPVRATVERLRERARAVVAPDDVGHVGDRQGPLAGKPAEVATGEGALGERHRARELPVEVQEEGPPALEGGVHERGRVARRLGTSVLARRDGAVAGEVGVAPVAAARGHLGVVDQMAAAAVHPLPGERSGNRARHRHQRGASRDRPPPAWRSDRHRRARRRTARSASPGRGARRSRPGRGLRPAAHADRDLAEKQEREEYLRGLIHRENPQNPNATPSRTALM